MDPLYTKERESRKRVWNELKRFDEENRRNPPRESSVEGIRQPLSIVQVERNGEGSSSDLLKLCYRPEKSYQKWLCSFCGTHMNDHLWSSFDRKENDVIVNPRFQPSYCTLYKLLDRMAQDFFPKRKVSLDTKKSGWQDEISFVFHELDDLSMTMSTTWISLQKEKLKNGAFEAMKINQQFKVLKGWLEICEKEVLENDEENDEESDEERDRDIIHEQCRSDKDLSIPAKRVLNLANVAMGKVPIVETTNLKGRYVALSHCWGDPKRHPLMTTHATLKDHMSGIKVSRLPRSFLDAIKVCVVLRVKYLWIDCLCIVQDDSDEWLAEAEKMAEIYQQSYLTIAATRAQNSQHGFLFDFPDDTMHYKIVAEVPWDKDTPELRTFHATFQIDHEASKRASTPLDTRAWCLQEWYLPKRVVEFCLNDIRLICLRSCETRFGRTNDEHTWTRTIVRGFRFEKEDFFRTLWENIRKDLFERSLTRASDKLPAMAGLAKMLEKTLMGVVDHKYLAGLWSTRMSEDLSWTVLDFDAATESIEGVPTWSWASTTAASDYIYGRPSETFVELIEAHCIGYAHPKDGPAFLKLKGFVKSLCLRVDHQYSDDYNGRPSMSFWALEDSAMATTTEEIMAKEKASRTTSFFVLDMPISPAPHDHQTIEDINEVYLRKVPSIIRASEKEEKCNICMDEGYVSDVELLLLTRTDVSMTALVLAPILSQSSKAQESSIEGVDGVYQRLGLLEIDCIRTNPWVETADGFKIPAETFWEMKDPSTRRTIAIV